MKKTLSNKYMMMGILAILLITAGTYAMFTWRASTTTDVAVSVDGVKILYVKGPDIIDATLIPTFTKEEGIVKEIKVSLDKTPQATVTLNFYLDVIAIAEELKHETFKWQLYKNGSLVNGDNFSLVSTGNKLTLTTNQTVTTTKDTYKLYIWIDGNVDNPDTMGGKAFSFKLRANGQNAIYEEVEEVFDGTVNKPSLPVNMIPIKYNGTTWVKADKNNSSNDWYDYNNKVWANAVTVTDATRSTYQSAAVGTPVPEDDILTYLVWIPRYKYQLFNSGDGTSAPEQEIQVTFEEETNTTGTVNCTIASNGTETCNNATNGNWYTHPAFTFGDDELAGLWVGKFEISHETLSSSTTHNNLGCTNTSCENASGLRIKPNVQSLRYNNISNMFYAARSMSRSSNPYGFNTSEVDTHMMKNIEWGAVAYLTQSKYGRCTDGVCTEIYINPSSSYITGRSGNDVSQGSTTDTSGSASATLYGYDGKSCNAKTGYVCTGTTDQTFGPSASTTGNIYGIYDISGGANEYVMGNMVDASGNFHPIDAGFNGGSVANPESKYYDRYKYDGTSTIAQNRGHLGDATRETMKTYGNDYGAWYSGCAYLVGSSYSWFYRGGYYYDGWRAGPFYFSNSGGFSGSYSLRLVLQSQ